MGENLTKRINTYYTYFTNGIDIICVYAFKGGLSRSHLEEYEQKLAEFIIEAAHANVQFYFPVGRQRGVEWGVVPC